jgi:hypothetical protein
MKFNFEFFAFSSLVICIVGCLNLSKFNVIADTGKELTLDSCGLECTKLEKVYGCFCDKQCLRYGDCCSLFMKNCTNYFSSIGCGSIIRNNSTHPNQNKTEEEGSCCSTTVPFDCFCDENCKKFGDCCNDFGKCTITEKSNKTISNSTTNEENWRLSTKKYRRKHSDDKIQPSVVWDTVLYPQAFLPGISRPFYNLTNIKKNKTSENTTNP